ncbi:MAG: putative membrane protein YqiK [Candidatus Poriferisodalaceae bacterium]
MVAPARADRETKELAALGEATKIRADGDAQIEVFQRLSDQYAAAGDNARDVMMLKMLVAQIVDAVKEIDIDKMTVIDNGSGNAMAGVASQMPPAVMSITEQIETATGINILEVLTRKSGDNA